MRKAIGFIALLLIGSFLLLGAAYGQERGKGKSPVPAERLRVVRRGKLRGLHRGELQFLQTEEIMRPEQRMYPRFSLGYREIIHSLSNFRNAPVDFVPFGAWGKDLTARPPSLRGKGERAVPAFGDLAPLPACRERTGEGSYGKSQKLCKNYLKKKDRKHSTAIWYLNRSFHFSEDNLLSKRDVETKKGESMGLSEQIPKAYVGSALGVVTGFIITWTVIRSEYGEPEEYGWVAYVDYCLLGATAGAPIGSAIWLNRQKGGSSRRFGWSLLGATIPTALMTTLELTLHQGGPPYVLMLSWAIAPIGAVIGYNLSD